MGSDSPQQMRFHTNHDTVLMRGQRGLQETVHGRPRHDFRMLRRRWLSQERGAMMDWLERFFVALTMLCAVTAALSIAWIMLI